jgi:uncharacterized protein YndB with AHSA1/START domain
MRSVFHLSRIIDAPAAEVWRLITDTHTWPRWGPTVLNVICRERFIHAGSRGKVQTPLGVWLPFVVTHFKPAHYWDWRVAGVAATGHQVKSLGRQRCELVFTVPLWAVAYGLVCRTALVRIERMLSKETLAG